MKRWHMESGAGFDGDSWVAEYEDPEGDWVFYDDVSKRIAVLEEKCSQQGKLLGMQGTVLSNEARLKERVAELEAERLSLTGELTTIFGVPGKLKEGETSNAPVLRKINEALCADQERISETEALNALQYRMLGDVAVALGMPYESAPGDIIEQAESRSEKVAELEGALQEIVCIALDDVAPRARLLAAIGDRAVAMVGRGREALGG